MPLGEMLEVEAGAVGADSVGAGALAVGDEFPSEVEIAVVDPGVFGELSVGDGVFDDLSEPDEVRGAYGVVGDVFLDVVRFVQDREHVGAAGVDGELQVSASTAVARSFAVDDVVGPVHCPFGEPRLFEWSVEEGHGEGAEYVGVVVGEGGRADLGSHPSSGRGEQEGDCVGVGVADLDEGADDGVAGLWAWVVGCDCAGQVPKERVGGRSRDGRCVGEEGVEPGWVAADDGAGGEVDGLVAVHVVLRSLLVELYERCGIDVPRHVPRLCPRVQSPNALGDTIS